MAFCDAFGGLLGGVTALFIGHPFDTVKVRQQVNNTGVLNTVKIIYQTLGLRGFYRGIGPPIITTGFQQAVFFGIYGKTMDLLIKRRQLMMEEDLLTYEEHKRKAKQHPAYYRIKPLLKKGELKAKATYLDCFIAGTTAGFARLFVACPIEVIKVRLQTQKNKNEIKNSFQCFKMILANQGIRGLYVGGVPLCCRAYGLGLYTVMYEHLKLNLPIQIIPLRLFLAGGTAGLIQWWLVLPFDVIKSRMQADNVAKPEYKGMRDCIKKVYRKEGFKGFFRGYIPLSLRAFPVNGVTFLTYEMVYKHCKRAFKKIN